MSKFINSKEAITSPLLLWQEKPTQISVKKTYDVKVWPITNIYNDGPTNFKIPPQPHGMLTSIDVVTKFCIYNDGHPMTGDMHKNLSIINNIGGAMWEMVEIRLDDRVDIMQSMKNAYAYQSFFNICLNSENNRNDYLFENEMFMMDEGLDKEDAENPHAMVVDLDKISRKLNKNIYDVDSELNVYKLPGMNLSRDDGDGNMIRSTELYSYAFYLKNLMDDASDDDDLYSPSFGKNPASGKRSMRINKGQSVTISSRLQCPLFTTSKCLPTDMKIRISLTKNSDSFLLLSEANSKYSVIIQDIYLNVTYYTPTEAIASEIEEQLKREPAPYFISKPEIIIKPIAYSNRIIRVNDVFHDKIPSYAFFCLQKSSDFEGKVTSSPFVFLPFGKFQIHVNGTPHFVDPLEIQYSTGAYKKIYSENGEYLRQLYKTIGKDLKGDCLINSKNFQLNFMVGVSFTGDRSNTSATYLNLQNEGSTYLEIDMGYDQGIPEDMILIIYAMFDRQIKIDVDRSITIIE